MFVVLVVGQYAGNEQPNDAVLVRIVAFKQSVAIMSSLRMPRVLTVLCSDGGERKLLVKVVVIVCSYGL